MRTPGGRRYRDIVDALIRQFGTASPVDLREMAGLRFALEQAQAAVVAGDRRAGSSLMRLGRLIERKEITLRAANIAAHSEAAA
jgi:hypothetical protein